MAYQDENIAAIATPSGAGAIGIIRISGAKAFQILSKFFFPGTGTLNVDSIRGYEMKFGRIKDQNELIDEVVVGFFKAPKSFTGENVVEISCHGSDYILNRVLSLCLKHGARLANEGEFTMRAYLNKKMDLAQAEAVADLISAGNKAAHDLAIKQMKGSVSKEISTLREELLRLASLVELELDFSEEDVEFADRSQLRNISEQIVAKCTELLNSFSLGNAIKKGIPVAIVGAPNAGKSTLLNTLLKENRAIVSDIEGTTRDSIEEEINIAGVGFRLIDTAGIRDTTDKIEELGIVRTFEKVEKAQIIIWLIDGKNIPDQNTFESRKKELYDKLKDNQKVFVALNKSDLENTNLPPYLNLDIKISAKTGDGIQNLEKVLSDYVKELGLDGSSTLISSARHEDALSKAKEAMEGLLNGMDMGIPSDLLAQDMRQALYFLGEITGEISSDEILGSIFSKFCIGK
ncbi:tRNA uridine-5-carboxymethylaminomethyl(34) synthesis GTPase MnmE [Luteibaculum oceani]|uniref:tRNA modification GTPase MnmE n=1 Tax=Luteibaculum oceani TaxID=1294296 RepID=A0A5C6UVV5_9FLAO|nr:tRNA uridine-5-carboxymethylaminomethyl(34) synthesis GTPase MnmE [Luteibaculum oceani]TXC77099.1 tRNA uridine-5-carboxymethylaminomethyl(34) synthesis GTPase MnmE [Luteibaculum oceani]